MTTKNNFKVLLPALAILLVCVAVFLVSSAGANNRDSASPDITTTSSATKYGEYRLVVEHKSAADGSTIMGPYEVYLPMPKGNNVSDTAENNQYSLFVEYRSADDHSEIASPHEVVFSSK